MRILTLFMLLLLDLRANGCSSDPSTSVPDTTLSTDVAAEDVTKVMSLPRLNQR